MRRVNSKFACSMLINQLDCLLPVCNSLAYQILKQFFPWDAQNLLFWKLGGIRVILKVFLAKCRDLRY